jgi:hypothetical protein
LDNHDQAIREYLCPADDDPDPVPEPGGDEQSSGGRSGWAGGEEPGGESR